MDVSRIYRAPTKQIDFLSRNKHALRKNKSRPVAAGGAAVRPDVDKVRKTAPSTKNKVRPIARENSPPSSRAGQDANTVVISKSYLEDLLRMSLTGSHTTQASTKRKLAKHVELDTQQIPGLNDAPAPGPVCLGSAAPPPSHQPVENIQMSQYGEFKGRQQYKPMSKNEQWLRDLAQQVDEKKRMKKQTEKVTEVYFPFGRPGGGAPIRDERGGVVADLRSKVRASYEGPVSQAVEFSPTTTFQQPQNQPRLSPEMSTDAYFPFGRPGGGAPIRDESGGVVADLRSKVESGSVRLPTKLKGPPHRVQQPVPSFTQPLNDVGGDESHTFMRGAGPFVDKYVLQEREQKRRRELEHRAYLAEQIAAKEHEKVAARLAKERTNAIEEARLAREKELLRQQHQREMFERQRKEDKEKERLGVLQRGIEEAQQTALRAKLDAKRGSTLNATSSLHSPLLATHITSNSNGFVSSKFDSVLRSPSLLHVQGHVSPRGAQPASTEKFSRIPVRRGRRPSIVDSIPQKEQCRSKQFTTHEKTLLGSSAHNRPPNISVRIPSPPVPALARRIQRPQENSVPNNVFPEGKVQPLVSGSPALARKFKVHEPTPQLSVAARRPSSPPVPALAKKFKVHEPTPQQSVVISRPPVHALLPDGQHTVNRLSGAELVNRSTHLLPLKQPPSCDLVRDGPPPETALPPINNVAMTIEGKGVAGIHTRQQVILQQLASLKEGILHRQSDIDQRVRVIMGRKRF